MTVTPAGPPPTSASGGHDESRGDTGAPTGAGNRPARSAALAGGLTAAGKTGDGEQSRTSRKRLCSSAHCPLPQRTLSVEQGALTVKPNADMACRWYRPFAFGEQGGDWFRIAGRVERYLDDWKNWPKSTDCLAKIRETAANPQPQDRDAHFGSLN
jgi:hypothetical protein